MRHRAILPAAFASLVLLTGCDITELDNYDPPGSTLTGRVVYEGQPVGVRSNGVQLELWQPSYELNQKIPVNLDQDGSFTATIFDGTYEINLLSGNGPWVSDPKRIPVEVNGQASLDIPVTPYSVIRNEQISFVPSAGGTGAIQATFNVGQIRTTPALEFVGIYIANNTFVDRNVSLAIPNAQRERTRAQIQTQLTANAPITFSVNLPSNIYLTGSPARREFVYVRVGVKTTGIAELIYSPVYKVAI